MIYISIENDYHFKLACNLIHKLNLMQGMFKIISHNSVRNNNSKRSNFEIISLEGHPLSDGMSFKSLISYIKSYRHVKYLNQIFTFKSNDILIIFTEYQLNNAILSKKIKKAGGKIFLFDEGIGFYFNNSLYHKKKFSFKKYIFDYIFFIIRIPVVARITHEGIVFSIKDIFIDKIFSRMCISIDRNVPIAISPLSVVNQSLVFKKNKSIAFFIATNFECFGLKTCEMDLSHKIINHLIKVFSNVYIKIHPSDHFARNEIYNFYQSFKGKNLKIIDNSIDAIDAFRRYKPAIVVGSMSTVLFDVMSYGGEAVFTYHLLPYKENFGVYDHTLKNIKYNFIRSIDEITPKYKSNVRTRDLFNSPSISIDNIEWLT